MVVADRSNAYGAESADRRYPKVMFGAAELFSGSDLILEGENFGPLLQSLHDQRIHVGVGLFWSAGAFRQFELLLVWIAQNCGESCLGCCVIVSGFELK